MKAFRRAPTPSFLLEPRSLNDLNTKRWEHWGLKYEERRSSASLKDLNLPSFNWPQYNGQKINLTLLPVLSAQVQGHCSYCDGFPFDMARKTIDHFMPASDNPTRVCEWGNLYLSCDKCQEYKGAKYDDRLLRPDDPNYSFEKYFCYNPLSGFIDIRADLSIDDNDSATYSLETFGFNKGDRPEARKRAVKLWSATFELSLEDMPYRFILAN